MAKGYFKWRNPTSTKEYFAWRDMRRRCSNPKDASYASYGGRGISVCSEWESYDQFYEDMGECPEGLTLDRIDVNGNYSKENCRWATWKEQHNNQRRNVIVATGETYLNTASVPAPSTRGWRSATASTRCLVKSCSPHIAW